MPIRPRFLFESRLNDAAPVASSTAAGDDPVYDVVNLLDFRRFTFWKPAAMPAEILVNSGGPSTADYLAVASHDLGTAGATIELQGSNDNFATAGVVVATVTPGDDLDFAVFFAAVSYSDWKIIVTGATAPTLAIVAFGDLFEIPSSLQNGYDPVARIPQGQFNKSETGAGLGSVHAYEKRDIAFSFSFVSWGWLRASWIPAWLAHLRGTPYLYLWNYQDYPAEILLLKTDGGFEGPHNSGSIATLSFRAVAAL